MVLMRIVTLPAANPGGEGLAALESSLLPSRLQSGALPSAVTGSGHPPAREARLAPCGVALLDAGRRGGGRAWPPCRAAPCTFSGSAPLLGRLVRLSDERHLLDARGQPCPRPRLLLNALPGLPILAHSARACPTRSLAPGHPR